MKSTNITWGTSFSAQYASELGLDHQDLFIKILDHLNPKVLRLVSYWNIDQPAEYRWGLNDLDFQIKAAEKRKIPYIIAVGRKVPRYPECFVPEWAKQLSPKQRQAAACRHITKVVEQYRDNPNLYMWQVENEVHVGNYGQCADMKTSYLKEEVQLVKSLSDKPVLVTGSGESWKPGFKISGYGDFYATSMYRKVLYKGVAVELPVPPLWFRIRGKIIKLLHPRLQKVFISELQAEPWVDGRMADFDQDYYKRTMNRRQFEKNISAARKTGFDEILMWGVEWWYLQKTRGEDYFWERGRQLFSESK